MADQVTDFSKDIEDIQHIPVVPSILEVICRTTGMRFAAVARVTDDRWVACAVQDEIEFGLGVAGELKIETTICNEIRHSGQLVAIDHVSQNEHFRNHHTPKMYGLESYISVPIVLKDGSFFGTLCAIDPAPANVERPEIIDMFLLYANLISMHLSGLREKEEAEKNLKEEQRIAAVRDKFIAILGHDLNNPLNAVMLSSQMLMQFPTEENIPRLANIINNSSKRMNGLINDILDFAKAHLGDGMIITQRAQTDVEKLLLEVIAEFRILYPERKLDVHVDNMSTVFCDDKRIAQLFSNLLSNAYKYGKVDEAIQIFAGVKEGDFMLSVANACDKIAEEDLSRLFDPFQHGAVTEGKSLGLGLYIASEIAKGHGASLSVTSTDALTTFTLVFPGCGNPNLQGESALLINA